MRRKDTSCSHDMDTLRLSMSNESIRITNELGDCIQRSPKTPNPHSGVVHDLSMQRFTVRACDIASRWSSADSLQGEQGIQFYSRHGSVDAPVVIPDDPPIKTPSSRSKTRNTHIRQIMTSENGIYKFYKGRQLRV